MSLTMTPELVAQLMQGVKRSNEESAGLPGPIKITRPGPIKIARLGDPDESWSCAKCGNCNWNSRETCNMRNCGAARPLESWTCPGCGNHNHENRPFCNMRSCGVAKPGLNVGQIQISASGGGYQAQGKGGSQGPGGSWECMLCGNANFPTRQYCNGKNGTCGVPRWQGESREAGGFRGGGWAGVGAGAGANMSPPGSWVCSTCQNVNFPTRMTCNGNRGACGTPRSFTTAKGGSKGTPPTGSWVCTICANVNFPSRTTCNGNTCGRERSEVDGGPPDAPEARVSFSGGAERAPAPEGAWTCRLCQNVNWPNRMTCNARACGAPRMD